MRVEQMHCGKTGTTHSASCQQFLHQQSCAGHGVCIHLRAQSIHIIISGQTTEEVKEEGKAKEVLRRSLQEKLKEWRSSVDVGVYQQREKELYIGRSLKANLIKGDQRQQMEASGISQLLQQSPRNARIIVTGEAGSGKPIFLRHITHSWLQTEEVPYDFVFCILPGWSRNHGILEIICQGLDLLPVMHIDSFSEELHMSSKYILFLLDSYEELYHETPALEKLIADCLYPYSVVLVTTRSGSDFIGITQRMPTRTEITLQDLSQEELASYIQVHLLQNQQGELSETVEHFFEYDFLQRPINLSLACYLYHVHTVQDGAAISLELQAAQTVIQSEVMQAYIKNWKGVNISLTTGLALEHEHLPTESKVTLKEIGRMYFHAFREECQWLSVKENIAVKPQYLLDFGSFTSSPELLHLSQSQYHLSYEISLLSECSDYTTKSTIALLNAPVSAGHQTGVIANNEGSHQLLQYFSEQQCLSFLEKVYGCLCVDTDKCPALCRDFPVNLVEKYNYSVQIDQLYIHNSTHPVGLLSHIMPGGEGLIFPDDCTLPDTVAYNTNVDERVQLTSEGAADTQAGQCRLILSDVKGLGRLSDVTQPDISTLHMAHNQATGLGGLSPTLTEVSQLDLHCCTQSVGLDTGTGFREWDMLKRLHVRDTDDVYLSALARMCVQLDELMIVDCQRVVLDTDDSVTRWPSLSRLVLQSSPVEETSGRHLTEGTARQRLSEMCPFAEIYIYGYNDQVHYFEQEAIVFIV